MSMIPNEVPLDPLIKSGILSRAMKLMNKVETGDFEKGNFDADALVQEGLVEQLPSNTSPSGQVRTTSRTITEDMVSKSKMPDAIKKAMLEQQIAMPEFKTTYTKADLLGDEAYEKPLPKPGTNSFKNQPVKPINETSIKNMVGMSESQVRDIVRDELNEFMGKYFIKSLTEDVQRKLLKQLNESGRLKPKK